MQPIRNAAVIPAVAPPAVARTGSRSRDLAGSARRRFPAAPDTSQSVELGRRTHDLVLDTDGVPEAPGEGSIVALGDPRHCRVQGSTDVAFGHYEYCGMDEGFFAIICDLTYRAPSHLAIRAENMLRVRIATEGEGEYAAARGDPLDLAGPSIAIVVEPEGQAPGQSVMLGRQRAIEVFVHRQVLARLYEGNRDELPHAVQSFVAGQLSHTATRRLPVTAPLLRALEDLQGCGLQGQGRRLVIRARAIEILCYAMEAFARDDVAAVPQASRLARNGVLKAQRVLDRNYMKPPSLDTLAHEVGLSRSGLCAAFRQVIGQSVYDYVGELRMHEALKMLTTSEMSVAEVAYAVGYGHPSSFSAAVQRRFGVTASDLRRLGPASDAVSR